MVDFLQHGLKLSTKLFMETETEDVGDLVGGETQQSDVARAFEELMDGKVALEDKVPAVMCPWAICVRNSCEARMARAVGTPEAT